MSFYTAAEFVYNSFPSHAIPGHPGQPCIEFQSVPESGPTQMVEWHPQTLQDLHFPVPMCQSTPQTSAQTAARNRRRRRTRKPSEIESERRRAQRLQIAFQQLRYCLPGAKDTRIPKVKVIREATAYIQHLQRILDESDSSSTTAEQCSSSSEAHSSLSLKSDDSLRRVGRDPLEMFGVARCETPFCYQPRPSWGFGHSENA